ncbi:TPA: hypothetical protein ACXJFH_004843, partial [Enterobacter kobei]
LNTVHTSIEHKRAWCGRLLILGCQEPPAQQPSNPVNWCNRLLKMTPAILSQKSGISRQIDRAPECEAPLSAIV